MWYNTQCNTFVASLWTVNQKTIRRLKPPNDYKEEAIMEDYQNPKMYEGANELYCEEHDLTSWYNSVQYTVLQIMRELHLDGSQKAYNLAKNIWANGCSNEEYIREQLSQYATSK